MIIHVVVEFVLRGSQSVKKLFTRHFLAELQALFKQLRVYKTQNLATLCMFVTCL